MCERERKVGNFASQSHANQNLSFIGMHDE
jgi:hypothetical protein